ncbi:hypothetical protein [Haloarchaeobius sp. FL176]|uniref:hypothetical protein n=1 Tax=Haloarchaeobius sp. FL176 TaxID=2967129 RepID=UPI0021481264|nr:hypothetical protein [Haloarchaeobius sp. FL176]
MPQDSITTRRSVLAGGAAALAGLAGCLGGNQVQKSEPDQDGEGTLGELRWILEETHGMSVTSMTYSDEVVDLEYESQASDSAESRDEIGQVISSYGLIIESDGPSARLEASIADRFESQAEEYHVEATWVEQWRAGEMSDALVAQRVFNTRRFPESATE